MRRIGRRATALFLAAGPLMAVSRPMAQTPPRLKVVASFSILGDMVANVGGERIDLVTLVGPDGDAHTYQPSPADARAVAAAQALVVNGLGFEGWIERLARAAPFRGTRIVAAQGFQTLTMTDDHGHGHGHGHGGASSTRSPQRAPRVVPDPHAWQDLSLGRRYVANIAQGLATADPLNAEHYRRRAAEYDSRLAQLDAWVRREIATVPPAKRKAIVGHDAFQYFAKAYGVEFRAPVGVSTDNEPSARDVANLIRQIGAEGIKAIFMENMTNPTLVQQIARDAGGAVGPALYVDALSKPGGPADTYEKMFRHNVPALVAGMSKN